MRDLQRKRKGRHSRTGSGEHENWYKKLIGRRSFKGSPTGDTCYSTDLHMDSNHQSSVAALQLTSPLPSPSVTRQTSTLIGDSLNVTEPGSSARSSCALTDACPQPRQDARDVKAPNSSLSSLVFDTQDASDGLTFYPLGRTPTPGNLRTIRFTSRGTRYKMQEVSDAVFNNVHGGQVSPRKRAASYFHGEEDWDTADRYPKRVERAKAEPRILQSNEEAAEQPINQTYSQCRMPPFSDSSPLPTTSYDVPTTPNINSSPLPTAADMDTDGDNSSALPSPSLSPISTSLTRNIAADESDAPMPLASPLTALPSPSNIPNQLIETYTALPREIRPYLLLHLLRRSSMKSLQFVHETAMLALRSDIIGRLPQHLARRVLSFCDVRTLCRATAVSLTWKKIIDYDEQLWHIKLQDAGFQVRKEDLLSEHIVEEAATADKDKVVEYQTPLKILYRRHHLMHLNWKANRCQRMQLTGHTHHVVTCLQFDEDKVVTGSDDCCVNIYDIKTGELKHVLKGHEGGVWALQYVGNTLVTGSTDRTIRVWDMKTGRCLHILRGHASTVRCLTIVQPVKNADGVMEPKEPMIVSGSRDTTLRVWRLPRVNNAERSEGTGQQLSQEAAQGPSMFQAIAQRYGLHPTEPDMNLYGSNWYPEASRDDAYHVHTLRGHTQSVRALDARGRILVSGSYDRSVRLWDLVRGGDPLYTWNAHIDKVYAVVIDAKRDQVISGSMDQTIHIFNIKTKLVINILRGHTSLVGLIGLTPNFLVSAAADQKLRVWSPDTGENMHVLRGHTGAITSFQHDERKVISGSEGGVKMWDIQTGKFQYDLIQGVSGVWRVAFDERRCIAAVKDNEEKTRIEVLDYGFDLYTKKNDMHS